MRFKVVTLKRFPLFFGVVVLIMMWYAIFTVGSVGKEDGKVMKMKKTAVIFSYSFFSGVADPLSSHSAECRVHPGSQLKSMYILHVMMWVWNVDILIWESSVISWLEGVFHFFSYKTLNSIWCTHCTLIVHPLNTGLCGEWSIHMIVDRSVYEWISS